MQFSAATSSLPPTHSQRPYLDAADFTTTPYNDLALYELQIYEHAAALLQRAGPTTTKTPISTRTTGEFLPQRAAFLPQTARSVKAGPTLDSAVYNLGVAAHDWQPSMYAAPYNNSSGGPIQGIKRSRSHQRTPSASTVASTGPASPYMQTASYPHIANTDYAPNSPAKYADQALYPKNLPTPSHTPAVSEFAISGYMPSAAAHIPNAHLAMKNFGFDYHNTEDYTSDFAPSRQSMSSYGNDSPATPQSGAGDVDTKNYNVQQSGENDTTAENASFECLLLDDLDYRQANPNVQLFRTESQAYQDELYNPNQPYTSVPAKPQQQQQQNTFLSPHRNLISERLQTANLARSSSPQSNISRERSPFRDGSPLAPSKDWQPAMGGRVSTAASMRQQQKDEAAEQEFARSRAPLRREPTKTISPKDALLEYNENDQQPLFQDSIPAGYKQHLGGTEQWPSNNFMSQTGQAFGGLPPNGSQNVSFRNATSADNGFSGTDLDFTSLPQSNNGQQIQSMPFQANYQAAVAAKMNNYTESTPAFPAAMPSMESSISDAGPPQSSQESIEASGSSSTPQRPNDTRANTGTYTCTYHGCTQRFSSHNDLQKHKRDYHRSQQKQHDSTSPSGTASSGSPRSTESPERTGGMTSAAILARNSQAGPHKCTRINPSTGKPCNTIFSRPYDLTRHEDTIHNNRKQKVRCPMCREEKTFSRNDALTRHMRVVHPEVETMGKRSRRGD